MRGLATLSKRRVTALGGKGSAREHTQRRTASNLTLSLLLRTSGSQRIAEQTSRRGDLASS